MPTLSQRDIRRIFESLRHLHEVRDRDSFAAHAAAALYAAIDCDQTLGFEIVPQSNTLLRHVAHNAAHWTSNQLQRSFHFFDSNPLAAYHAGHPEDGSAHMTSDFLSQREWRETAYYNETSASFGTEREMSIVVSRHADWAIVLGAFQGKGRKDFSERDRLVANLLRPHLAHAFQTACLFTAIQQDLTAMQATIETFAHAVVLVEANGRIRWASRQGRALLSRYCPQAAQDQDRLPDTLREWLCAQKARAGDVTTVPAPPGSLLIPRNVRALRIHLIVESDHDCLVLKETGMDRHTDTQAVAGLTARESEVLAWVAQGKSNDAIATILGTRPRTIHKHLERIYQKLGVENRMAAVTRLQLLRHEQQRRLD